MRVFSWLLMTAMFLAAAAGCDDHTRPRSKRDGGGQKNDPMMQGMAMPPGDPGQPAPK